MVEKQLPVIDGRILGWTISTLGDDDSLEKFFEAMPGFFDSEKVKDIRNQLPYNMLRDALAGFLGRTLSSETIIDSVKFRRLGIFMNTISLVGEDRISSIFESFLSKRWDLALQTIEVAHTLERWCNSNYERTALFSRCTVARILGMVLERDDRWVEFAACISGLSERDLRDTAKTNDNLCLAALIDFCRQANHSHEWKIVNPFGRFNIRNALPRLQHDFCMLWNEFVDKARIHGDPHSTPVRILCSIRELYAALHPGAASTEILQFTDLGFIMLQPSSYPQCNNAAHRHLPEIGHARDVNSRASSLPNQPDDPPHSLAYRPRSRDPTVTRQLEVKQEGIITSPRLSSEPTSPGEITERSQEAPTTTSPALLAHSNTYPTHASLPLPGPVAALQDIPVAAELSCSPDGTAQQDIVAPFGKLGGNENLSVASMPALTITPAPVPGSTPPVLNKSLAPCDIGAVSAFNPLLSASSVIGSCDTVPRLRVRGLVNTGSMCFANAVLQLFVRSPPLWSLFGEQSDLKGLRQARGTETGGAATPLVDATVRFFEEFMPKEKEPSQEATGGKPREDEKAKKGHNAVDSFEPIYMYDAMKEKAQIKDLLVRRRNQDSSLCY